MRDLLDATLAHARRLLTAIVKSLETEGRRKGGMKRRSAASRTISKPSCSRVAQPFRADIRIAAREERGGRGLAAHSGRDRHRS
jgi:hypothetical protein